MKNPNDKDKEYPAAVDGKVPSEYLGQKTPAGKFGPSVTTGGSPGTPKQPGEVNIAGTPGTPSKPGAEINIGGK
jgi:hypothetical protein